MKKIKAGQMTFLQQEPGDSLVYYAERGSKEGLKAAKKLRKKLNGKDFKDKKVYEDIKKDGFSDNGIDIIH